ncbi:hypothetical protein I553_8972 [Mycobacterium xenopi 4042]|uniref:Uncharacterized protein n=1 Tax=Mycobacterium xenopi 4042 TaxID=1299334 RepID=X8AQ55_MYCXE|nr:hypothetical protein I553_8972 [Mycobacterium xenopi 4042]
MGGRLLRRQDWRENKPAAVAVVPDHLRRHPSPLWWRR